MKRVFLCAPFDPRDPSWQVELTVLVGLALEAGVAPISPHLLYARHLHDERPGATLARHTCAMAWLEVCDEVWVYGQAGGEPSPNQMAEMALASQLQIPLVSRTTRSGVDAGLTRGN